ncbi:MAG: PhzF family phenazine biosynthesis protein [Clostridia bacterium]|nr:PhzF family phenazine biosynthesis protein [Clostridia bacterium]
MNYYVADIFTDRRFGGNPAGVCLPDHPLDAETMQRIAAENNLSETAFATPCGTDSRDWDLRWFTPEVEIDLCGHATLATAFILMNHVDPDLRHVAFRTMSGVLTVDREGDVYQMGFPRRPGRPCPVPDGLEEALGAPVLEAVCSRDLLVLLRDEAEVAGLCPDHTALARATDAFGIIATAPGSQCDFVSRYFAPGAGIPEDPATGSSHCTLIPYWSGRLGKTQMTSRQLSRRGGAFLCGDEGDRVRIGGRAVLYLAGRITVD